MSKPHNRKMYEEITCAKARNNSIKSDIYPTFNDIQINNIKTFANRINTPLLILNNNCKNKITNNIILQSQPLITSNIYTIYTHNNINNSQRSNIDNHQPILYIQNRETFILNSILNNNCNFLPLKNKLNNPIILKSKLNHNLNMANTQIFRNIIQQELQKHSTMRNKIKLSPPSPYLYSQKKSSYRHENSYIT